jgi:N-acyl-D-aspartate/D-glutamate deacylase
VSNAARSIASLDWRGSTGDPAGDLVIRDAAVLDPRAGIEGNYDVVVRDGAIAELANPGAPSRSEPS